MITTLGMQSSSIVQTISGMYIMRDFELLPVITAAFLCHD